MIEYWLFILHLWMEICRGNKPELWKIWHRMSAIFPFFLSGTKKFKNIKGDNIVVCNIPCNFPNFDSIIFQWKSNIKCWIFIPPHPHLYKWIEIMRKPGWDNIECSLFILHWWTIICRSNKPEYWKN